MFYELRTYRLKTGTVPRYLKLVEEEGIAIQSAYLGGLSRILCHRDRAAERNRPYVGLSQPR